MKVFVTKSIYTCARAVINMDPPDLAHADEAWLQSRLENLEAEVESQSKLLVRLLHTRDQQVARLNKNFEKLTEAMKQIARDAG